MAKPKIGDLGFGGQGESAGHAGSGSTVKELLVALRDELDALYAKLDADSADTGGDSNYAATLPKFEK